MYSVYFLIGKKNNVINLFLSFQWWLAVWTIFSPKLLTKSWAFASWDDKKVISNKDDHAAPIS